MTETELKIWLDAEGLARLKGLPELAEPAPVAAAPGNAAVGLLRHGRACVGGGGDFAPAQAGGATLGADGQAAGRRHGLERPLLAPRDRAAGARRAAGAGRARPGGRAGGGARGGGGRAAGAGLRDPGQAGLADPRGARRGRGRAGARRGRDRRRGGARRHPRGGARASLGRGGGRLRAGPAALRHRAGPLRAGQQGRPRLPPGRRRARPTRRRGRAAPARRDFDPEATVETAARDVLRDCLGADRGQHGVVAESAAIEGPHQLRVGLRRLRTAFAVFAPEPRQGLDEAARGYGASASDGWWASSATPTC